MEHDPLKELVEASARKLPYQRNHVREDLDFEIIPNMVYNDGPKFIDNCLSGKEDFICYLFNNYYEMMNPIYYQDDPKHFRPVDFHVGVRSCGQDKHILFVQLPDEFMGSLEFCRCYAVAYETYNDQINNLRFFCVQESAYGWRRIGEIDRDGNSKFITRSSGNIAEEVDQICRLAFQNQ